jgi:hypothetical protein
MKPAPTKPPRLPKGRVMYANAAEMGELDFEVHRYDPSDDRNWTQPIACIPCRSQREAKAVVRMHAQPDRTLFSAYRVANPDVGYGLQLDFVQHGAPQLVIYHVWTIGTYKNGHPMFDLRAVTTDSVKANMYSEMLRRDKDALGETWYRVHIEPRVANHLYGECMKEYREATGRLPDSPPIGELRDRRLAATRRKRK